MMQNCLQCGEKLRGRSDKKFCDDQCRNQFNNERARVKNPCVSYVNYQLKKNRSILEILFNVHKDVEIPKRILAENGYNFSFFTHEEQSRRYCYEFGYEQVNELKINLVRWNPKV